MKISFLGSSSKGNSYLLYNKSECLIVDAGISMKDAMKVLDFDISKVRGVCITHEHL